MLTNYFLWLFGAALVGAALYLLCRWLFGISNFVPLIVLLAVIFGIGVENLIYLLFFNFFLLFPIVLLSMVGAYYLIRTTRGAIHHVKAFLALQTLIFMECLWFWIIIYVDGVNKLLRNSLSSIYQIPGILFLLTVPILTAFLVWWRLKATDSLPIE